jgi:CheY-like chemotaxis protein
MPRVLVVEDSPTQALCATLEANAFAAEAVADAEAALARLAAGPPVDLVLSDIVMPGLSGYDLCRRLKTDPRTQAVPVVLLTVLTDPLDVLQGLECGADNFLTKPCDPDFLVRRLRAILGADTRRAGPGPGGGVALSFRGRGLTITRDKGQILDLLVLVAVTGYGAEEDRRLSREAGFDSHLVKPVGPEQMQRELADGTS